MYINKKKYIKNWRTGKNTKGSYRESGFKSQHPQIVTPVIENPMFSSDRPRVQHTCGKTFTQ